MDLWTDGISPLSVTSSHALYVVVGVLVSSPILSVLYSTPCALLYLPSLYLLHEWMCSPLHAAVLLIVLAVHLTSCLTLTASTLHAVLLLAALVLLLFV